MLIANITQMMFLGETVMKLVKTHTIIKEHTIVAIIECFFHPIAVEIIPTAEDKIPIRILEIKSQSGCEC